MTIICLPFFLPLILLLQAYPLIYFILHYTINTPSLLNCVLKILQKPPLSLLPPPLLLPPIHLPLRKPFQQSQQRRIMRNNHHNILVPIKLFHFCRARPRLFKISVQALARDKEGCRERRVRFADAEVAGVGEADGAVGFGGGG